jgi:hypothetical protein
VSAQCAKALELIAKAAAELVEHAKHDAVQGRQGPEVKDAVAAVKAAAKSVAAAGHIFGDDGAYGVAPKCIVGLEDKVAELLK